MLGFVQSWFTPSANPIGIDFGSDGLRMAQVEAFDGGNGQADFKLVAAARADVPAHLRHDPAARFAFFTETVRELWVKGNFRGRRAVIALPAATMTIQHLRIPKMDEEALKKALPWEARGKLPYDPSHALLRHLVAGEIHQDGEQKNEIILMAAHRESVNGLLAAAVKARLDVVGMSVEPKALIDCFGHVYRRKADAEVTNLFVDIGCAATRAYVSRGAQVMFARSIPIGGEHLARAVAAAMQINVEEAKVLRIKACHAQPPAAEVGTRPAAPAAGRVPADPPLASNINEASPVAAGPEADQVAAACRTPVARLVEELSLCRRYHEATFPNLPIDRLVFVGGEARHRGLCQEIAQGMDLAAQVGDPLVRMGRTSEVGIESGMDRRQPQPDWAVAIGSSMGPVGAAVPAEAAK